MQADGVSIRHVYGEGQSNLPEVLLVDRKSCFEYKGKDGDLDDEAGIYSSNSALVGSLVAMFDNLWDQAMAYDTFREAYRMKDDAIEKQRELYDKLREAGRLKDEFINIAAHELRTPIMPILAGVELLESELHGNELTPAIKDDLAILSRNAKRLLKLSEDILQASRIETGRLKLYLEQVNINALISDVIMDIEKKYMQQSKVVAAIEKADLRSLITHVIGEKSESPRKVITFDPGQNMPLIESDRNKVTEVVFNILDNAMKFIDAREGAIQVSTRLSGPSVFVNVRDNGRGIDPSIRDKIFEKFTTRSEKGSGLGLYIARSIVEAHGGQIWAGTNSDGNGVTFTFNLPVHFMKSDPLAPQKHPQTTDTQRTIVRLRGEAMGKIEAMKSGLVQAREDALRKRNEALDQYQKKVDDSRNLIKARQEIIKQQINYERTRSEVGNRVEKGLQGLQRLIEGLRENILGDETVEKVRLHPKVSDAIRTEARKVTESDFFRSIKKQLGKGAGVENDH
jgi:signal transduction histidine kinase